MPLEPVASAQAAAAGPEESAGRTEMRGSTLFAAKAEGNAE